MLMFGMAECWCKVPVRLRLTEGSEHSRGMAPLRGHPSKPMASRGVLDGVKKLSRQLLLPMRCLYQWWGTWWRIWGHWWSRWALLLRFPAPFPAPVPAAAAADDDDDDDLFYYSFSFSHYAGDYGYMVKLKNPQWTQSSLTFGPSRGSAMEAASKLLLWKHWKMTGAVTALKCLVPNFFKIIFHFLFVFLRLLFPPPPNMIFRVLGTKKGWNGQIQEDPILVHGFYLFGDGFKMLTHDSNSKDFLQLKTIHKSQRFCWFQSLKRSPQELTSSATRDGRSGTGALEKCDFEMVSPWHGKNGMVKMA